jgi:hypothetical protein
MVQDSNVEDMYINIKSGLKGKQKNGAGDIYGLAISLYKEHAEVIEFKMMCCSDVY